MGRPKGSKNKPKVPPVVPATPATPATPPPAPKAAPAAPAEPPKRKGRKPGSKNKPKVQETPAPAPVTPPEEPKRKGRQPKVVVPTLPAATPAAPAPPPIPAGAAAPVVITKAEPEEEPVAVKPKAPVYTVAQLNDPALDDLAKQAQVFFEHASPSRKVMFEGRATDTITVERAVLRTLVDFFEIDVAKIIHGKETSAQKATK